MEVKQGILHILTLCPTVCCPSCSSPTPLSVLPLPHISICKVQFTVSQGFTHVIVGGVRGWDARTGKFALAFLDTYLFSSTDGSPRLTKLDFVHRVGLLVVPVAVLRL